MITILYCYLIRWLLTRLGCICEWGGLVWAEGSVVHYGAGVVLWTLFRMITSISIKVIVRSAVPHNGWQSLHWILRIKVRSLKWLLVLIEVLWVATAIHLAETREISVVAERFYYLDLWSAQFNKFGFTMLGLLFLTEWLVSILL